MALNIASLALGWDRWLWYAEAAGAITVGEREQLWPRVWKALCDLGAEQARCQLAADPASTYLRALSTLVTSGRAYLAAHDGGQPAEPQRYGWQFHGRSGLDPGVTFDTERERYGTWEPQGALIGWVTEDGVFLDPAVAYRAARQFAEQAGTPLGVSDYALRQQLRDRRLLASTGGTGSVTVQRRLGGRVRSVLHLSAASFDGDAG